MQLLLSNPPKSRRRKRRKSKAKSNRPQARRKVRRRRRRATPASAGKGATMARKRKSPSRRTRRGGNRSRGRVARGGFLNTELLTAGAAVSAGFLGASFLPTIVPESMKSNRFVVPVLKIGAGLLTAAFLGKRFSPTLTYSAAAGMVASGALDIVGPYLNRQPAGVSGYESIGNYAVDMPGGYEPVGEYVSADLGAYALPDGTTIEGYMTDKGEVVAPSGYVAGYVDLAAYGDGDDTDAGVGELADDDADTFVGDIDGDDDDDSDDADD